jgi:hypothetical protein
MKRSHRLLRALADSDANTLELAAAIEEDNMQRASALLTYLRSQGHVERIAGGAGAGVATWRLTDGGRAYLGDITDAMEDGASPQGASQRVAVQRAVTPRPTPTLARSSSTLAPVTPPRARRYGGEVPEIESGIPIPGRKPIPNKYRELAERMAVGDSVAFPEASRGAAVSLAAMLRKLGHKSRQTQCEDGRHRVWRVS